ncbi:hypothetical protein AUJ65_04830 [Candidatus Micrarchaeota archaeon CG1_02_51_15]|nr:MAG: hypothetical protein AUJ65_04830 [Candidatus Micrarchaeota archaeon CG1_02_51_15]
MIAERTDDASAAIPEWEGERIPVPNSIAQETAELLALFFRPVEAWLKRGYLLSDVAVYRLQWFALRQKNAFVPSPRALVAESFGNFIILHSFNGSKANACLAHVLSALLSASIGSSVRSRPSAYLIAFEFPKPYPVQRFVAILHELTPENTEKILLNTLPKTSLFLFRFLHAAKRSGFISKDAQLHALSLQRIVETQKDSLAYREAFAELLHDKFAVSEVAELISGLRSHEITLQTHDADAKKLSSLAKDFLEFTGYGELFAPPEPTAQIVQAFKDNLLLKKTELACAHCAKKFSRKLSEVPPEPICPYCLSSQVTLGKYAEVLEKKAGRKTLSVSERAQYKEALRVASLSNAYGRKAIEALETYGVGPETAARVLKNLRQTDEDYYSDLLEAQKNFVRTKKYWRA